MDRGVADSSKSSVSVVPAAVNPRYHQRLGYRAAVPRGRTRSPRARAGRTGRARPERLPLLDCERTTTLNELPPRSIDTHPRERAKLRAAGIGVTVFSCGWVLMTLEIVGGRLLSPVFGSGVWVWGSVISVFLAALSIGYFLGGFLSRRWPRDGGLSTVILLAGVTILPVAFWYRETSEWIADLELHEQWGSLLASIALFLVPSALLGMVSPYAVRLVTRRIHTVGVSAGTLYAISTLGSCLGCLYTAFYLIVSLGITSILLLSSAILAVIATWQLVVGKLARPFVEGDDS